MLKRAVVIGALIFVGLTGLNAVARANAMSLEQMQSFLKKLDSQFSLCEKQKDLVDSKECDFGSNTKLLSAIANVMSPANKEVLNSCEDCKKSIASIGVRLFAITERLEVDIQKSRAELAKNRKSYSTQIQGMELYLSNFTITTGDKRLRGFLIACELRSGTNGYIGSIEKHIYENVEANQTFTVGEVKPIHVGFSLDMDQVKNVKCGWYDPNKSIYGYIFNN